ncbi:MAG: 50S ribosomal protein L23 [Patescibacteria group bacterium]|nr:50S ribosomal protein L23 [Patescibacteria group bacterium]
MQIENIILKPIVTEKSTEFETVGKYIFKVMANANKIEVKKAVEKVFGTKVADVNILNTQSKEKRRGRTIGHVAGYKKAIVTLKKGQKIKIREEKKETKKGVKKEDKKVEEKVDNE